MIPDYPLGETLDFKFTTRAFATGIPTVLAGVPVVEIYEDDSITQITAAETLSIDFDGVVGLNNLRIVATSGNGFESGKSYAAILSAGTVGGVSVVGEVVAEFTIERSPALRPTTAGRTLGVEADGDLTKVNTLNGHTAQTGDSFARIGANGAGLTSLAAASIFTGMTNIAQWLGLIAGKQAANATALSEIKLTGAGAGAYDEAAQSLEAIRIRGDIAWITGGGGGITDILNVQPHLPTSIDLAGTATVRLGLMLTNALDDLPSTAEITPGTISIERKAIGGTSWSAVVTDAACSEKAGEIYYDEVFDAGSGYAEGDSIRITFKSQKITVSANDYEITDATGVMFQTEIRQTMRGTEGANTVIPPTESQMNARTLASGAYFDPTADAVSTVTTLTNKTGFSLSTAGILAIWHQLESAIVTASTIGLRLKALIGAGPTRVEATADKDAVLTRLGTAADTDIATDIANVKAKVDLLPEQPAQNAEFVYVIKLVDSTDHVTPKTGLTVTMTRSLDGGAFAGAAGSVVEIATGHYKVTAAAGDMNDPIVAHRFTATDTDDLTIVIKTTA